MIYLSLNSTGPPWPVSQAQLRQTTRFTSCARNRFAGLRARPRAPGLPARAHVKCILRSPAGALGKLMVRQKRGFRGEDRWPCAGHHQLLVNPTLDAITQMTELINSLLENAYNNLKLADSPAYTICRFRMGQPFTKAQETAFDLRDSLIYRKESTAFHVEQIIRMTNELIFFCNEELKQKRQVPHEHIEKVSTMILYTLDDLIFNMLSLYDYMAKLFLLSFIGKVTRKDWHWLILHIKVISKKKHPRILTRYQIDESEIKEIINENQDLIRKLSDIRSDLLHNRAYKADSRQTYYAGKTSYFAPIIDMPKEYEAKLPQLRSFSTRNKLETIDIVIGSSWLFYRFSISICKISNVLIRRINKEKELLKELEYKSDGV